MKRKSKFVILGMLASIVLFTVIWIIFCHRNCGFWDVSFYEILSVSVGAILGVIGFAITLIIVEGKNDERRFIDAIAIILDKMDEILISKDLIPTSVGTNTTNYKKMMSAKKRISNYITILEKNAEKIKLSNEISFVKKKFNDYEIMVDSYISLKSLTEDFKSDVENTIGLIDHKICEMRVNIYNK